MYKVHALCVGLITKCLNGNDHEIGTKKTIIKMYAIISTFLGNSLKTQACYLINNELPNLKFKKKSSNL